MGRGEIGSPPSRCVVLDIVFITLSLIFFAAGIGYITACERLMK
jgi:hypothetical protein